MKNLSKVLFSATLVLTALIVGSSVTLSKNNPVVNNKTSCEVASFTAFCETCGKDPETTLKTNMRKLWEDHVTWTRNVIFCLVDDLPGGDQTTKRLLDNQTDIGNAVKPYYGEEAGKKLSQLLHDHIAISADVIKAAKTSN